MFSRIPIRSLAAVSSLLLFPIPVSADLPVSLELEWARLADPAGNINGDYRNGITSGESAEFSQDGQYILTTSKSDGRTDRYDNSGSGDGVITRGSTGATSHMRLWDLQGNLIWDIPRNPGGSGQPSSGEDEMEVAVFTRDDNYVAGAGDDGEVRLYQVRDLTTRAILATPVLVKTFDVGVSPTAPNGTFRGIDSLRVSPDGDLLIAGNENAGRIDIFRIQGDPSTWTRIRNVDHGGSGGQGVNSVEISDDGQYVGSAGSNETGGFWEMHVARDGSGLITDVTLDRVASMKQPTSTTREIRFQPNIDNSSGERNELVILTAEHDHTTYVWRMQDLIDNPNPNNSPPPLMELRNSDGNNYLGTPPEPATFTRDGRFLVLTGKTRNSRNPHEDAAGIDMQPAYIRIYETAEIQAGAPEPDPVHVRREGVYNPEYVDVNPAGNQLTSSHHDGSVRLWAIHTSDSRTLASEAFNESTASAGRWTLTGSRSTANGDNEFGSSSEVGQDSRFTGHRGTRYIAVDTLNSLEHTLTLDTAMQIDGFAERQLVFAAAAETGGFTPGATDEYIRLHADLNGGGNFDVLLAEFTPDSDGDLSLSGTGEKLDLAFDDFLVDLEPHLAGNPFDGTLNLRLSISNKQNSDQEIGFDSLRVIGKTRYLAWAGERGLTSGINNGFTHDANDDGIPNGQHFALDTDPLGDRGLGSEGKRVHEILAEEGEETGSRYFTLTFPVRKGAVFAWNGVSSSLVSQPIDGVVYEVFGDNDLIGSGLEIVERSEPVDTGALPPLGDYDGLGGPDYEYRSFRFAAAIPVLSRAFMWVETTEAD